MIGLFMLLVASVWLLLAVTLGFQIPKWLGIKRFRIPIGFALAALIFVAPIGDEIIAYPQLKTLCKSVDSVEYNPKTAAGQTVSKYSSVISNETKTLFPGIQVRIEHRALVTPVIELPIVKWGTIKPQAGFMRFPAGSSGDSMPLLLSDCGFTARSGDRLRKIIEPLKLVETDYQPSK